VPVRQEGIGDYKAVAMSEEASVQSENSASDTQAITHGGLWLDRIARAFGQTSVPFDMYFPDGAARRFGQGLPSFCVRLKNRNAVRAITSLDQVKFADAYLAGDIDIDGDMLRPFELRQTMGDLHPLMTVWRFLQPLLMGQVRTNQAAITSHYDIDAEFFLDFLDPKITRRVSTRVQWKHLMPQPSGSSTTVTRSCG
jgi:cyclopropane-fatty-acyl-phospholipid synthase